jgi:predicted RNA-binding Zn ribbon-like protein
MSSAVGEVRRRSRMPGHYVVIDGLALPSRLSGHAALDFCNTLAGWNGGRRNDYLRSYEHLAVWAEFVELLAPARVANLREQAARESESAAAVLAYAKQVRGRLYDVFADQGDPAKLELISADLQTATSSLQLVEGDGSIEWEIDPESGLATPVLAALWSAAQLLVSPESPLVKACPGSGCGWLFRDRTGRRRWCTMATCGNREKARAFSARRRGAADAPGPTTIPSVRN